MNNKILKNYLLGQKYFPARVWSLFPAAGPRVAKCQYFYTDQNCQTKFYPKKRVNCNSFDTNKKDTFGEQLLITLPILTSLYTQIVTKNGLILPTSVFFQTFTPTCQYFYTDISIIIHIRDILHGYIHHIRDILQLCLPLPSTAIAACPIGVGDVHFS